MIITEDDSIGIEDINKKLHTKFEVKDLGLWFFLELEVTYFPWEYILSLLKNTLDLIARALLTDNQTLQEGWAYKGSLLYSPWTTTTNGC